jgi:hypothetical protein
MRRSQVESEFDGVGMSLGTLILICISSLPSCIFQIGHSTLEVQHCGMLPARADKKAQRKGGHWRCYHLNSAWRSSLTGYPESHLLSPVAYKLALEPHEFFARTGFRELNLVEAPSLSIWRMPENRANSENAIAQNFY